MELVFASNNPKKVEEARASMAPLSIVSLASLGWTADIPETANTLLGNARLKAQTVFRELGRDCFADDTGLEIEALDGQPGVFTARFAGPNATGKENRAKTLRLMEGIENRRATFRTVIVLILDGREHVFEGRIDGEITLVESGSEGLGYAPIFRPDGFSQTYGDMTLEERARISHRAIAIAKMRAFLDGK